MKRELVAFASGLLFAIGLCLAGMTWPEKILSLLDVFGTWDPSLALAMICMLCRVVNADFRVIVNGRFAPS